MIISVAQSVDMAGHCLRFAPTILLASTIKQLLLRSPDLDPSQIDDVIIGCANQAGEDNRNVARMAVLLSGMPVGVSATTINRLCASGMDAVATAAMAVKSNTGSLYLAGGVESMSRAPLVVPKNTTAFSRNAEIYDTTIGWRLVNKRMAELYGTDSMPETAQNVADDFKISRERQDRFALRSQKLAQAAMENGTIAQEIFPVSVRIKKDTKNIDCDEHPRANSTIEALSNLKALFKEGSVTAGNASGNK